MRGAKSMQVNLIAGSEIKNVTSQGCRAHGFFHKLDVTE